MRALVRWKPSSPGRVQRRPVAVAALALVLPVLLASCRDASLTPSRNAHPAQGCARANVVQYFLRKPDGNSIDGSGFGYGSLSRLRDQSEATTAIDGSTTYTTWADFGATLKAVIVAESQGATDV